jgi:hypothetical protein
MPMENIKQKLSDVAHHWTVIVMITLFLFGNNTVVPIMPESQALVVKPKTEVQLKKET